MKQEEQFINGNTRVRYNPPRMKVVELNARNCILANSMMVGSMRTNRWNTDNGSYSSGSLGDDEGE